MAFHLLLLKWHPMVGCDLHLELTFTWPPVPVPFTPHVVGQRLAGFGGADMTSDTVLANNWNIIRRDSDISYGIPHVPIPVFPPCVLALLWTGLSGSKSYFGPSTVHGNGKPIAAALLITQNPQLNCDDPFPLPTGMAFSWSNVVCGLSWGDIIGGLLAMAFDMAVGFVLNKIGGKLGGKVVGKFAPAASKVVVEAINLTVNAVFQQLTGSPIGYSFSVPEKLFSPYANPGNWGKTLGHGLGNLIDGQPFSFGNDLNVDQH
ncbi:hypothetical protein [Chondromyces crocatus]|uniref:Uncharacterized protein n=1 Tax=Chondromyces crocatus TaxID=52 RepID=A0A0K1EK74_CHOCO|nr:hypothetical protein [Chondromyces crocatus]AKT41266.1 uncharacterized protein CMC5_054330 [Chondromyces crocatus]